MNQKSRRCFLIVDKDSFNHWHLLVAADARVICWEISGCIISLVTIESTYTVQRPRLPTILPTTKDHSVSIREM